MPVVIPPEARAPEAVIPQVPPGPAPQPSIPTPQPVKPGAPQMESPAGTLSPEQLQIVQIALSDPLVLNAIAEGVMAKSNPQKTLFG